MQTDNTQPKYFVRYGMTGRKPCHTVEEVWAFIGTLPALSWYSVVDNEGRTPDEFLTY